MALDYNAVGAAVTDTAFQNRVMGALAAQCIVVNGEAGSTANHNVRLQLMQRIVRDPVSYAQDFAPILASVNPLVGLSSLSVATDAQILTAVQAVFDAFATQNI